MNDSINIDETAMDSTPVDTPQIPKKIGKYEIHKELGRGAMGIVYEGYDTFMCRHIALKVANLTTFSTVLAAERYKKSFFNEAHTAGKLKHPNIIEILNAGAEGNTCYIAMELVEGGKTLIPYCEPDNLLPYTQVAEIIYKCATALDYAHRVGIMHRDIKPTNILFTKDMDIRLCDFSIAHLMTEEASLTMPTGFVGSPRYMSPEQIHEDEITQQTDLFSLGVVMYELLSGKHPFPATSFSRLIYKIVNEEPEPLSHYRKDVPKILERIIFHCLQKNIEDRYKKGSDIVADLSLAFDYFDTHLLDNAEDNHKFTQLKAIGFFAPFSAVEAWEIVRTGEWQKYKDGELIPCAECTEDALVIIITGKLLIHRDNAKVNSLSAGNYFGLEARILEIDQSINIYAKKEVSLLTINATIINRLSMSAQIAFTKALFHALTKNNSLLYKT